MALIINPADWQALQAGLDFAFSGNHKVTVLALGDSPLEETLHWCLAAGASEALRVWDDGLADADVTVRSQVMAAALTRLKPDLVLCGDGCLDQLDTVVPGMAAAVAGYNYVPGVTNLESIAPGQAVIVRYAGKGRRERVQICLPALLAVDKQDKTEQENSDLQAVIRAFSTPVTCLDFNALGLSPRIGGIRHPKAYRIMDRFPIPATSRIAIPDSGLPAEGRISQILTGPIKRKQGEIISGTPAELAEKILQYLHGHGAVKE
jgi:electron transfer flavoprotein beta subunit